MSDESLMHGSYAWEVRTGAVIKPKHRVRVSADNEQIEVGFILQVIEPPVLKEFCVSVRRVA